VAETNRCAFWNAAASKVVTPLFSLKPRVAHALGVKINDVQPDAVLNLDFAKIMQLWLPSAILSQIIGHTSGEENVTGIATVHHSLGSVDS